VRGRRRVYQAREERPILAFNNACPTRARSLSESDCVKSEAREAPSDDCVLRQRRKHRPRAVANRQRPLYRADSFLAASLSQPRAPPFPRDHSPHALSAECKTADARRTARQIHDRHCRRSNKVRTAIRSAPAQSAVFPRASGFSCTRANKIRVFSAAGHSMEQLARELSRAQFQKTSRVDPEFSFQRRSTLPIQCMRPGGVYARHRTILPPDPIVLLPTLQHPDLAQHIVRPLIIRSTRITWRPRLQRRCGP